MADNLKTYDSVGGFSVGNTPIVNELKDGKNFNTLEIRNSFYPNSYTTTYILRGLNTTILSKDDVGSQIILPSDSISFITARIIAVNAAGTGHYSKKLETNVGCDAAGTVTAYSSLETIIKDSIPDGESWSVNPFDSGAANRFSYTTNRSGTTEEITWVAYVEVATIEWNN